MILSVVATLYFSEAYIEEFYTRIKQTLDSIQIQDYEIILVNDGSPDAALDKALSLRQQDNRVVVVDLSRNFGHHKAIRTGLEVSTGDYVFLIDIDLEEKPELLADFWRAMQTESNTDVIYGIQQKRKGAWFERQAGRLYYQILNYLIDIPYPADTLTARLMTKRYVESVLSFQEKTFDIWCNFVLAGFQQKGYVTQKYSKGSTTYTLQKKVAMAVETVTSVSNKPLYYIFYLGTAILILTFFYVIWLIFRWLIWQDATEGWTSIIVSIWAMGGMIIFCIGVLGIYISKLFIEVKQRPIAIIRKIYKNTK